MLIPCFFCTFAESMYKMERLILNKINKSVKPKYKLFLRFLKENGVFKRYFEILRKKPQGCFKDFYYGDITYFFNHADPLDWTTECFTWTEQEEGGDFWENIHYEWDKCCAKNGFG